MTRGQMVDELESAGHVAARPRFCGLTELERKITACIMRAMPNKLIAWELGISYGTVRVCLTTIMRKTGTRNRRELLGWAVTEERRGAPNSHDKAAL